MQNQLRPNLPPLPRNMQELPIDSRGYPVPFFVEYINGIPEFRVASRGLLRRAVLCKLCWICGKPLGNRMVAFTIGPMCAINRISAEPPQHPECAEFAVHACPFMLLPRMRRREDGLPEKVDPAGIMNLRNPGVTVIWLTRRWEVQHEAEGYLFRVGTPIKVMWYAEGRKATRDEVTASIDSGLPSLRQHAVTAEDRLELEQMRIGAMRLLPPAIKHVTRLVRAQ